jgi:signal transduction histidine kinase
MRIFALFIMLFMLTVSTLFAAQGRNPVVVGGNRDYPPYEFLDKEGKPAGFNIDLTRAIAEVMGFEVEFRMGGWSDQVADLKTGRIDLLQGLSWSERRENEFDFTPSHTIVHHAIFARKGSPVVSTLDDLKGKKVIVHRDGIMHNELKARGYEQDLVLTPTPAEGLRLLASGKYDYSVVAMLPGIYIIRENKLTNLVPVARDVASYRYGYAVKKGNTELQSRFSEGLAILHKTGKYQEIHRRWLGVLEPNRISWESTFRYVAVIVVPLLLVLGGTVFWSHSLRKQVVQRTASLSHALEELQSNQRQLVQADKLAALGTLVSGVAHEINNPNGLIMLDIPILKRAYLDAVPILDEKFDREGEFDLGGIPYSRMRGEISRIMDEMQEGSARIKRIVHDLKDFSRKSDDSDKHATDFNEVVQTAVRLVEPTLRTATEHFNMQYGTGLPSVRMNPQRIEQVVINLLVNACQALPDASRGISLTTAYDPDSRKVVLQVRDEGKGIAKEHLQLLTDPFFTTKRETGGTGLGLSVSAGIVKEHDGELQFSSEPGRGTTVTLTLPITNMEQPI